MLIIIYSSSYFHYESRFAIYLCGVCEVSLFVVKEGYFEEFYELVECAGWGSMLSEVLRVGFQRV